MFTVDSSGVVERSLGYPQGLKRLPQLLKRIDGVRFELAEISTSSIDLADQTEALDRDLGALATAVETKVEINRARERRRTRHRRHESNGHAPIDELAA